MKTPIVELSGVSKTYGDTAALANARLVVERGEMLAIVGPSGSGKSTMLNIMGTLSRPTSGTLRIDGHDVNHLSDRELSALRAATIGFVFQSFHLAPGVPALDSVADGILYGGRPLRERRRRARQTLQQVGLGHRLYNEPHQLSGGEQQRVAIARAIVGAPPLLLADEPTGALDSRSGAIVMALLNELHQNGTTVVVITHDRDIAASLPRQVSIKDGRIELDSTRPDQVSA
ncbi:ABC transporter ATP-binding protein [Kribbella solani]|uniref:ABC transporter ATP-binding protein n=1 Tax=Kribbella solani TaxID=236067 RepID=UPI0029B3BDA7|nr:ABC transporter ATP-binding protein [Kribbella solani]MDX3006574.1 ABC transporter ATP-binding protein [Kribbella solani]